MRARVRSSGTYYYYDSGTREIPLGSDYLQAVLKWADLEGGNAKKEVVVTLRSVAESYLKSPRFLKKAPRTQVDNLGELKFLYQYFDDPPVEFDRIEPHDIAKYRDWRESTHSTQEIALLSAMWMWAREQGITKLANPTTGVERNRGEGRDVYVTDEMFDKVYLWADQPTKDAMDLAHLAGQRPGDSLKMTEQDIRDGALWVGQNKTGAKLRVRVTGKLKLVIDRIMARKAKLKIRSFALVVDEKGQKLTPGKLDYRFGVARECAGFGTMEFQFRDLRAKAGTEVEEASGMESAQNLLGHANASMTKRYVRNRIGKLVDPTK